jgi:hypothetical protein
MGEVYAMSQWVRALSARVSQVFNHRVSADG